ncbi:MAG: hypothetical protein ABI947_28335 [Chloroflexota bacterium]
MMIMTSAINEDVAAALPTIDDERKRHLQGMINRFYYPLPSGTSYNAAQAYVIAEIVVKGAITAGYMARPDGTPESQRRIEFAIALIAAYIQHR